MLPGAFGVMFHHFHGSGHAPGQGTVGAAELERAVDSAGAARLLPAAEWVERVRRDDLPADAVCLTFDDNLRSQLDVAVPVLERLGLTAFFFVQTGPLRGEPDRTEVYRHFRESRFATLDDFHAAFEEALDPDESGAVVPAHHLAEFAFYTGADRRFRFLRDDVLGPERYHAVMEELLTASGTSVEALAQGLWMDAAALAGLHSAGHVIGLHSHSHPTRLAELPEAEQRREYERNAGVIEEVTGERPAAAAHPVNSYGPETLAILRELGVEVAFRSNTAVGSPSALELQREDIANLA
ncbi:MAG: polysaccharide deacetylase family protein [Thermoleophilaceae bacterium]|nr:polysaccharide deacetylase family protein [Thermoleophilaceae bacterium]